MSRRPAEPRREPAPVTPALIAALTYLQAGLSVIPIKVDGSKEPALPRGHPVLNRRQRATDDEARLWWGKGTHGIAILGGSISGNTECIDFDDGSLAADWATLVNAERPGLVDSLTVIATPTGGWHVWYRCPAVIIDGNKKLASDPSRKAKRTLIETRGEGGYALIPPSPAECHPLHLLYQHVQGPPLQHLVEILPIDREAILRCARAYDHSPPVADPGPARPRPGKSGALLPGDDFNARGPDWSEILGPHQWKCVRTNGPACYWQRPGKTNGVSATTGHCKAADGTELLHVFSSNAAPFDDNKAYSKFRAHALLNHAGDLSAAAAELRDQGYGDGQKSPAQRETRSGTVPPTAKTAPPAKGPKPPPPEHCFTGQQLMRTAIPPIKWAVPGIIPEGSLILAGRPKSGKSWLVLHIAVAVATGGKVLESTQVQRGPVIYLALEDNKRRLQRRLAVLGAESADLSQLHFRTEWPALNDGGFELLESLINDTQPRMVIVDTLGRVRQHRLREDNAYAADYAFAAEIASLANRRNIALVAVHHTSKAERDDPVDEISGTLGIAGAFDTIAILKRTRETTSASLFLTGRDVDEHEYALTIDINNQKWENHGNANDHRISEERQAILTALLNHPDGMRPRDLSDFLMWSPGRTRHLLFKMLDDSQLNQEAGVYRLIPGIGVTG